jgi:Ion channel
MMDAVASPGAPQTSQRPDSRSRLAALRDIVLGTDSYGIVFIFLVVDYVFLTVGWTGSVAIVVSAIWLGLTVLMAFRTSEVPHRLMVIVRVAVAVVVVAAVGVVLGGGNRAVGTVVILSSLLVFASPIAIGWRLLHHTRVTTQTVLGALCIYILIGLVFANADYGVQLVSGNSFFAQPGPHGPGDFAYFSYITMATVGYGDLSPAVGLPRTNAVLEALMGQIFLVVLVARLVGMYTPTFRWGQERRGGFALGPEALGGGAAGAAGSEPGAAVGLDDGTGGGSGGGAGAGAGGGTAAEPGGGAGPGPTGN